MGALDLAATEHGSGGKPLLVLHGVFGSARNWSSIVQRLAGTHHVLAVDARNHGASPWAEAMPYAEMVEDVAQFRRARGLRRVSLLGHSMGGKTAMLDALEHPGEVERLVVVDVAPAAYPPVLAAYARALREVELTGVTRRSEVDARLAGAIPDAADRAFLLQNLVLEEGGARWRLNLPVIERFMPEIAGFPEIAAGRAYPGPTLFIGGANSSYIRPEHRPTIERLFPGANIVHIPDAGHWVHAEHPRQFLDAVTPFLAGGN
jgi:pimeloyl-ACP methyl ester carboxylesterase